MKTLSAFVVALALAAPLFADPKVDQAVAKAEDQYKKGRPEEAVAEYKKAMQLGPTFVDIRTRLAQTLRDLGRIDEAVRELERALSDRPQYLPARVQLGVCLYSQNKIKDALTQWNLVLKQDPTHSGAAMYVKLVQGDRPR